MICVRANSMPTQTKHKTFVAKTAVHINTLKDIRRWLIDNCKNKWTATDYKGYDFNWRKLGRMKAYDESTLTSDFKITIIVEFKKAEDMMLYMLSWPSEVLLND